MVSSPIQFVNRKERTDNFRSAIQRPKPTADSMAENRYGLQPRNRARKCLTYHWPGSDVRVKGQYPEVWFNYNKNHLSVSERNLYGLTSYQRQSRHPTVNHGYFEEPDHTGHNFGPQDPRTREAFRNMDAQLHDLWDNIQQGPRKDSVNLIVVSDHGMTFVTPERKIECKRYLNPKVG